jgi:hypothetical protein
MKKITVTVGLDGNATIKVEGFKGKACLAATKEIEEAIGSVESRKPTREMGSVESTPVQTQGNS